MMISYFRLRYVRVYLLTTVVYLYADVIAGAELPADWLENWHNPPAQDRPLQIVHNIAQQWGGNDSSPNEDAVTRMRYYADLGLGGIVSNVPFEQYLRSEAHWQLLKDGIQACAQLGLIVWIYDEQGYPSGAAGGMTLRQNPEAEALELAWDTTRSQPFILRPAFEHTHASNNYHVIRRYLNLLDREGVQTFIDVTHNAYYQRLSHLFGGTIQAFFTDEPSLIAVNIGAIPESARKDVAVADPVGTTVKVLPCVPWVNDLPEVYNRRYGEDLIVNRISLFAGEAARDKQVRRQFWGLIADLTADRYFGALQAWCQDHGVSASGHTLSEESIIRHTPLEGNALQCLARMHIPGMDMLSSYPGVALNAGARTAALASSAAELTGGRRVMTEISDFAEKMKGAGPASLTNMQAAAAWQAAMGVTDFTLYYKPVDRRTEEYHAYCDFVGRINAILKPADYSRRVLLYYPIEDLWEEYIPVAEPILPRTLSKRAQLIAASFDSYAQRLTQAQIPFTLVDHTFLAGSDASGNGRLRIGRHNYTVLIIPTGAQLRGKSADRVQQFQSSGGMVIHNTADTTMLSTAQLQEQIQPPFRISPSSDKMVAGAFHRDGRPVIMLVNIQNAAYHGFLETALATSWASFNPATGAVTPVGPISDMKVRLNIVPYGTIILVGE